MIALADDLNDLLNRGALNGEIMRTKAAQIQSLVSEVNSLHAHSQSQLGLQPWQILKRFCSPAVHSFIVYSRQSSDSQTVLHAQKILDEIKAYYEAQQKKKREI